MINLIIDILKADANIVAITTTSRIYPVSRLEGGVIPAIVVQLTGTDPADTHDTTSTMDDHTVQVTVIEDKPKDANALAVLVRAALDGYAGNSIAEIRFVNQATDVFEAVDLFTQTMVYSVKLHRDNVTIPTALADLGILNLDDISDVALDEPLDREALVYDEATTSWINGGPAKIDFPVTNNYAGGIALGTVVAFNGVVQGDRPQVVPFSASSASDPRTLVGIASETMAFRTPGHVRSYGTIYGLNTNAYPVGTILYASTTAGQLTSTPPSAPNHRIAIGVVTRQHANTGRIFVRTYTPGYRIGDLSDVSSAAPTSNMVLTWDGTKWAPALPTGGYLPGGSPPPGGYTPAIFYRASDATLAVDEDLTWVAGTNTLTTINVTGSGIVKGTNTYGARFATEAATNRALANATGVTVERYFTCTAEGNGESFNIQSNTPSAGNKIVRKIWYKNEAFETTDVNTWTLVHTFANNATYASTATQWAATLEAQTYGKPPFTLAISWEDVPVFTGLLDTYGGAAAAYSVRLLDKDYTGSCIRVRRASDNTEQDIGFDGNGDLDTSALTSFCTGTNGFVRTWYDQSGNANNATQTTTANQPKIYDSSTGVVTENSEPALQFDGTDSFTPTSAVSYTNLTWFTVTRKTNTTGEGSIIFYQDNGSYGGDDVDNQGNPQLKTNGGFVIANSLANTSASGNETNQHLSYYNRTGTSASGGLNGEVKTPATVNTTAFVLNNLFYYNAASYNYNGKAQEVVLYNSDQSANRSGIETNINSYFSIY